MLGRILFALAVIIGAPSLTGCAGLSVPGATATAPTFNDKAGEILADTSAVVKLSRTLLAAGKITPDQADQVADLAEQVQISVNAAKQAYTDSGGTTGASQLRAAAGILDQINAFLATKQGK